jgi:phytoene synthase
VENYATGTASNLIALAAQILNGGRDAGIGALAHHAGLAYALTGLLKAFPTHSARGQLYVPGELLERHGAREADVAGGKATPQLRAALAELRLIARRHLAQARELIAAAPPAVIPALLVLAPVAATLNGMERRDYDPFATVEIAPWRRQWLIWRAARRPARMFG